MSYRKEERPQVEAKALVLVLKLSSWFQIFHHTHTKGRPWKGSQGLERLDGPTMSPGNQTLKFA